MKRTALILASVAALVVCLPNLALAQTAPTVAITAQANPQSPGVAQPNLSWTSSGAAVCTASGGWSGNKLASGSTTGGTITTSTTYTLTCQASGASTQLSWTPPTVNTDNSPLTDLTGYNIYAGASASSLAVVAHLTDPSAKTYTYSGTSGPTSIAVTAVNSQGVESALSNVVQKTLAPAQASASATVNIPNPPTGAAAN